MNMADPYTKAWLQYNPQEKTSDAAYYTRIFCADPHDPILANALQELCTGAGGMYAIQPEIVTAQPAQGPYIALSVDPLLDTVKEGYTIHADDQSVRIVGKEAVGVLYGAFHLLRLTATQQSIANLDICKQPSARWRMLNHWDMFLPLSAGNTDSFLGRSLFFHRGEIVCNQRTRDYLRMLASVGINGLAMHNVLARQSYRSITRGLMFMDAKNEKFFPMPSLEQIEEENYPFYKGM